MKSSVGLEHHVAITCGRFLPRRVNLPSPLPSGGLSRVPGWEGKAGAARKEAATREKGEAVGRGAGPFSGAPSIGLPGAPAPSSPWPQHRSVAGPFFPQSRAQPLSCVRPRAIFTVFLGTSWPPAPRTGLPPDHWPAPAGTLSPGTWRWLCAQTCSPARPPERTAGRTLRRALTPQEPASQFSDPGPHYPFTFDASLVPSKLHKLLSNSKIKWLIEVISPGWEERTDSFGETGPLSEKNKVGSLSPIASKFKKFQTD